MNEYKAWHNDLVGAKVVKALSGNGFRAAYYKTKAEAAQGLLQLIPTPATIGAPGSSTLRELGVLETLEEHGNIILNASVPGMNEKERMQIWKKQLTCDVLLTSSNAVTMDGCLVNTDAIGNRVAAMIYGPGKVIVVVGINKIVRNLEEALARIRNVAAPMNNKRLERPNPCVKTGQCTDCRSSTRICNVTSILHKCPRLTEIHVILVGEALGF